MNWVPITKTSRLMAFKEIITLYFVNYLKHVNTLYGQNVKLPLCLETLTHRTEETVCAYSVPGGGGGLLNKSIPL
jgi:hypothetical protein